MVVSGVLGEDGGLADFASKFWVSSADGAEGIAWAGSSASAGFALLTSDVWVSSGGGPNRFARVSGVSPVSLSFSLVFVGDSVWREEPAGEVSVASSSS